MQRYFVLPNAVEREQSRITITGDDVGHITKVMRSSIGDQLICCDSQAQCFLTEIMQMEKDQVGCRIIHELKEDRELPLQVTIAQGLPKGDKMELVIQKGTELGAHVFVPFISSRTIVQLDSKKEQKRIERWSKIAKEAAEQSHRSILPEISAVHSWKQLMNRSKDYDLALIAYENEKTSTIHAKLREFPNGIKRILIAIGPEGGFSEQEIEEATLHNFHPIMLGKRILRTETAGLYGLAALSYYYEQLEEGST